MADQMLCVRARQVALIMSDGQMGRTKMKASDFRFGRVKGWMGGDATERIEGWKTYVYEAAGRMKTVNIVKVDLLPWTPKRKATTCGHGLACAQTMQCGRACRGRRMDRSLTILLLPDLGNARIVC